LLERIKEFFMGISIDEVHEETKEIVREVLSKENFAKNQATHATRIAEARLLPLLDSQIGNCYAVAITDQTNQFIECCEEIEHLNKGKAFFQKLNKKVTQVHTSVNKLRL
jgi:hypothetical protein